MARRTHRPRLLTLRILLWRSRAPLLVAALLLTALVGVRHLAPPPPTTVPVVVAAKDLPAGHVLDAADLAVVRVPERPVPPVAPSDEAEVTGRGLAVSIPRGLPVVEQVLTGARFDLEAPTGTVVVPVSLVAASAAGLLRAGDLVDLVAPAIPAGFADPVEDGPQGASELPAVLARGALVLDVGGVGDPAPTGGLSGLAPDAAEVMTLVAVSPEEGLVLAAASTRGPLGAVLVR